MPDWLRTLLDPTWRYEEELRADEALLEAMRRDEEEHGLFPHNVISLSSHRSRQRPARRG